MTRRASGLAVALGFLGIGVATLTIAAFVGAHALSEARIGRTLAEDGIPVRAFVVTAQAVERSQCSRSQRAICTASITPIATVVFETDGRRTATQARLTGAEFEAFGAGREVFIDLIASPDAPTEVERSQGARLAAAEGEMLTLVVLATFGITFAAIGGFTLRLVRKGRRAPSTGLPL